MAAVANKMSTKIGTTPFNKSQNVKLKTTSNLKFCILLCVVGCQFALADNKLSRTDSQLVADSTKLEGKTKVETNQATLEARSDAVGSQDAIKNEPADKAFDEKRAFVVEFLQVLHDQFGPTKTDAASQESQKDLPDSQLGERMEQGASRTSESRMMTQLLDAISAGGDIRRLTDWTRNSFSLSSLGEVTTQFVVSKLGSVNCPAILRPDREETLVPRFLLFNEHFVDVPFELSINPTAIDCIENGKFDPNRKTIILVHGFLAGYTLLDGIANIKNRLLDLNKISAEQALEVFVRASQNNGTYVLAEDLQLKVRQQQFNVIIVDWFNGANPIPRANYIRAAVNSQVVGQLIARFLSALVVQCGQPAVNMHIIAHSLGKLDGVEVVQ